jgi:hypothetical protein
MVTHAKAGMSIGLCLGAAWLGGCAGGHTEREAARPSRIVLVHADGRREDVGEHRMSARALAVTEGSPVGGIGIDRDGRLVSVQLAVSESVPGLNYAPGAHRCAAIVTDQAGRVVAVEAPRGDGDAEYRVQGSALHLSVARDAVAVSLHKAEGAGLTRYWCEPDPAR